VSFLFFSHILFAQNCTQDNTPPVVKCKSYITITKGETIYPEAIDDGSEDDCTIKENLKLQFCRYENNCTPQNAIFYPNAGRYKIFLTAEDESGNTSSCETYIFVVADCQEDYTPPQFEPRTGRIGYRLLVNEPIIASRLARAEDNCTPRSDIKFSYSPDPNDDTRTLQKQNFIPSLFTQPIAMEIKVVSVSLLMLFQIALKKLHSYSEIILTDPSIRLYMLTHF